MQTLEGKSSELRIFTTVTARFKVKEIRYQSNTVEPRSFPKRPLLRFARFSCDIYAKFFLLLLNNEEVEKLRCKLSGYIFRQYTLDMNEGFRRSAVELHLFLQFLSKPHCTGNSKQSSNQELIESSTRIELI